MAHQGDVLNLSNSWLLTKSTISSILLFTVLSGRGMCPTLLAAALPESSRQMFFAVGKTSSSLMSNGTFLLLQYLSPTNMRPSVQQHYQTITVFSTCLLLFWFSQKIPEVCFFFHKSRVFCLKACEVLFNIFQQHHLPTYLPTYQ